jgi:hypothetical protein
MIAALPIKPEKFLCCGRRFAIADGTGSLEMAITSSPSYQSGIPRGMQDMDSRTLDGPEVNLG